MSDRVAVRIVDVFDAPREAVFAAWTEPERLKQWWGPGFFETVFAQVDLRPGGRYELLLEPGSMRLVGEFREVTPPSRLVYTWRWIEGVPDTRESLVTVEFRADGTRTEVVLVHDNFVGPGPVDMYDQGWRSGLDKLRAFLPPKERTNAKRTNALANVVSRTPLGRSSRESKSAIGSSPPSPTAERTCASSWSTTPAVITNESRR